jgi:hypothetical protein
MQIYFIIITSSCRTGELSKWKSAKMAELTQNILAGNDENRTTKEEDQAEWDAMKPGEEVFGLFEEIQEVAKREETANANSQRNGNGKADTETTRSTGAAAGTSGGRRKKRHAEVCFGF